MSRRSVFDRSKPLDIQALRSDILDHLMSMGSKTTEDLVRFYRGRHEGLDVIRALHDLRGQGLLRREKYGDPWLLPGAQNPTSGPTTL